MLYRAAQEALTNVMKHATGAAATVGLAYDDVGVTVTIDNVGIGNNDSTNGRAACLLAAEAASACADRRAPRAAWRAGRGGPHPRRVAGDRDRADEHCPAATPGPGPTPLVRVLIADDQRVVREGLAIIVGGFPETEVVGQAGDGAEAITLVEASAGRRHHGPAHAEDGRGDASKRHPGTASFRGCGRPHHLRRRRRIDCHRWWPARPGT